MNKSSHVPTYTLKFLAEKTDPWGGRVFGLFIFMDCMMAGGNPLPSAQFFDLNSTGLKRRNVSPPSLLHTPEKPGRMWGDKKEVGHD